MIRVPFDAPWRHVAETPTISTVAPHNTNYTNFAMNYIFISVTYNVQAGNDLDPLPHPLADRFLVASDDSVVLRLAIVGLEEQEHPEQVGRACAFGPDSIGTAPKLRADVGCRSEESAKATHAGSGTVSGVVLGECDAEEPETVGGHHYLVNVTDIEQIAIQPYAVYISIFFWIVSFK